jgi:hypothetical protein
MPATISTLIPGHRTLVVASGPLSHRLSSFCVKALTRDLRNGVKC